MLIGLGKMPGNLKHLLQNKCEGNMAQGVESHNSLTTEENKHHSLQKMTERDKEKINFKKWQVTSNCATRFTSCALSSNKTLISL